MFSDYGQETTFTLHVRYAPQRGHAVTLHILSPTGGVVPLDEPPPFVC